MRRAKQHLVILQHPDPNICAEGLRCALGLTLCGAHVSVFLRRTAQETRKRLQEHEPSLHKTVQYLVALGHDLFAEEFAHEDIEIIEIFDFIALQDAADTCTTW